MLTHIMQSARETGPGLRGFIRSLVDTARPTPVRTNAQRPLAPLSRADVAALMRKSYT